MKKHLTLALALLTVLFTSAHAQLPSYLPADGLVGWWPFNGNANDESGNGNDGVVDGAAETFDRFGTTNSAYDFDSSFIVVNDINLSLTSNYSISLWINPTSFIEGYSVALELTNDNSCNSNPIMGFWWSDNLIYHTCGNINNYVTMGSFSSLQSQWTHYLIQLNNGSTIIYRNGVQLTSGSINWPSIVSNKLTLGSNGNFGQSLPWHGKIDDIAIYNRALTEQEIQNLYIATNTGNTVDTGDGAAPLPQGIPYQAAARDGNGQPVVDSPVNVRFSLREGAADGAASYIESHSLTTNSIGLFNTVFGNGTPEQSAFDSINWAATTKFLQVEVDLGNGYVDMGTTQLLSVPYAFRSAQAANIKNAALPIYPDNTAALAGGLVAGEMYRTATGDLKIAY